MGSIRRGDEALHYCDGSHRWLAPTDADQETWRGLVKAHQDEHLSTMGGVAGDAPVRRVYVPSRFDPGRRIA